MINGAQNITREPLGRMEAHFLVKVATKPTFSIEDTRRFLGLKHNGGLKISANNNSMVAVSLKKTEARRL